MQSLSMKELSVGQKAEKDFIVTKETGVAYADVSGDKNPLECCWGAIYPG